MIRTINGAFAAASADVIVVVVVAVIAASIDPADAYAAAAPASPIVQSSSWCRSRTSIRTSTRFDMRALFLESRGRTNCRASRAPPPGEDDDDERGKQQNTDEDRERRLIPPLPPPATLGMELRPLAAALRPKHACRTFPSTMAAYARDVDSSS